MVKMKILPDMLKFIWISFTELLFLIKIDIKKFFWSIISILLLVIGVISSFSLFENVPAGAICVIQSPINGSLEIYTDPGIKPQFFGKVTYYPKSALYKFDGSADADGSPIPMTFNDSGEAKISGSIRYDYPLEKEKIVKLHMTFSSHQNVIAGLIKPTVTRACIMTGPLMSSIEAFMSRKSDLPMMMEDQAKNGLYRVYTHEKRITDETTGATKTIKVAEPITDSSSPNGISRQEESIVAKYGIVFSNLAPNDIAASMAVRARVDTLFDMYSKIETSALNVKMQEQETKAKAEEAKKNLAVMEGAEKAKTAAQKEIAERDATIQKVNANRDAEVARISAQKERDVALIEANRKREVAEQEKITAALYKEAQTLRGEGDAAYKKAVMTADGALAQKLATYERVQELWAQAFQNFRGPLVPSVVTGGSSAGSPTSAMNDVMQAIGIKALKDLALDIAPAATR